jgi:hypothetical protein
MFTENLDAFLSIGDFAVAVVWNNTTVCGIFDAAYVAPFDAVGTVGPRVLVKSADVDGIAYGDALTVDDVGYRVTSIQPDGTGLTELALERT